MVTTGVALSNTHPVIFVGRDIARFLRYKVTYLLPDHQYRIKERAAARIRADVIFGRDSEIDDLKSSLEYGTSIEETAVFLCRSGSGRPQRERNERRDVRAPDLSYVDTSMHLHGCAKLPCSFW
jgi:hypothetical protein